MADMLVELQNGQDKRISDGAALPITNELSGQN